MPLYNCFAGTYLFDLERVASRSPNTFVSQIKLSNLLIIFNIFGASTGKLIRGSHFVASLIFKCDFDSFRVFASWSPAWQPAASLSLPAHGAILIFRSSFFV